MYAVIETGGKQYKVKKGDTLNVELLKDKLGSTKDFSDVLAVGEGASLKVGTPLVASAKVSAEVIAHTQGPKIIVFHKKRRKQFKRKVGHRQPYTYLLITELNDGAGASDKLDKQERDAIVGRIGVKIGDAFDPATKEKRTADKPKASKEQKAKAAEKAKATKTKKVATAKKAAPAKKKAAKKTAAKKKTTKKPAAKKATAKKTTKKKTTKK